MSALTLAPARDQLAGPLRFIRYGFMPNRLRYCGGDDNRTLLQYAVEGADDGGLRAILGSFTGALPYLRLIAQANGLSDPFDERVVEAYWLGNSLLDAIELKSFYDALAARFDKQLLGRTRELVLGKVPAGARPHHNFHVFDVHSRVGELEHSLATMDGCRVSWGRVLRIEGAELVVARRPLQLHEGRLMLGPEQELRALRQVEGHGFADEARPGDTVSLHWGWVCEVLAPAQLANLTRYTEHHLRLANQTL